MFAKGGYEATQAEAVPMDVWRDLLKEAIEQHTDMYLVKVQKMLEEAERRHLRAVSRYLASRKSRRAERNWQRYEKRKGERGPRADTP